MDLGEFLLARIAEDEADARQLAHDLERWQREQQANGPDGSQGSVIAALIEGSAVDPARVLAEREAKRAIVKAMRYPTDEDFGTYVLGLLALPYAGHADYQQGWSPTALAV